MKLCSAFDIVRIHLFGDEDEKKSFRAMADFASKDEKVKMLILEKKQQEAETDFDITDEDDSWKKKLEYEPRSTMLKNSLHNQPLFYKMIFCGDCGRALGYHRSIKPDSKTGSYHCQNYFLKACVNGYHTIAQTKIVKVVQHVIADQLTLLADFDALTERIKKGEETSKQIEYRSEVQRLTIQMKSKQAKREHLYEDFRDGILTPEEYTMMKQRFDEEYQQLNRELNAVLVKQAKLNRALSSENKWMEHMRLAVDGGELTHELVEALIEKVLVYENAERQKSVEVVMKYQEDFETLREAWLELKGEDQE